MKPWVQKALEFLTESLTPPCIEPTELDWKSVLSADKKRLAEHLMAFANHPGGGFLVFGIGRDSTPLGMSISEMDSTANSLANLGREAVEPPLQIDHSALNFKGADILLVYIPESSTKPVHRRGRPIDDTCVRSGPTTRKATRQEVGQLMLHSRTLRWETAHASLLLSDTGVLEVLALDLLFRVMQKDGPVAEEERLKWMQESGFIERHHAGGAYVTNLGAISIAENLATFPELAERGAGHQVSRD